MPSTPGMKAGGFYDSHSDAQGAAIDAFLPWLVDVVDELPLPPVGGSLLTLLDLGSSQGKNAIRAMRGLVETIRRRTDAPAWVVFSDLPTNDFNRLFANLFPHGSGSPPPLGEGVFAAAVAGSAYGPIVPAASLHAATSFNMIGWLDALPPARLPRYILATGPSMRGDRSAVTDEEREPFRRQAASDLRRFYRARAGELVPGGKLLVQVFGRDEASDRSASDGIYDVVSDALLDLVDDGILPAKVYEDLIFPLDFRTVGELVEPIESEPDLASAFRVDRAETVETPVPFNAELERDGDIGEWARRFTRFLRAFTEPVVAAAIPANLAADEILANVYRRVEARLEEDPARYEFRFISVGVLLTRTSAPPG
ncbi:MAG: class I SAM-dependent methyltransferase [Isosphaeraceae bacterium]